MGHNKFSHHAKDEYRAADGETMLHTELDNPLSKAVLPQHGPSKLLVIGCGPAAQRNYFSILDKMAGKDFDQFAILVELESARNTVEAFTNKLHAPPKKTIWLAEQYRTASDLPPALVSRLNRAVMKGEIDGIVILSEPKSHLPYLKWAITHQLPILLEKPLSAPIDACISEAAAHQIWQDYLDVESLLEANPGCTISLMAQRRVHSGFQFIMQYIREFVAQFEIAPTFVDIFKSDGQWTFPHEYAKENHPFKYGYGMLLHGGYHFIDVLAQVINAGHVPGKEPDSLRTSSSFCWPSDSLAQISPADYARLFPGYDPPDVSLNGFGDLDSHSIFEFSRGDTTVAHGKISLMHNGFSRRAWPISKADTYKGNGRVRHERLHMDVGPLLSIMAHSYEAFEQHQRGDPEVPEEGQPGGHNHFDVQIYRNADLVGGEPFESFSLSDLMPPVRTSHIQDARASIIKNFLSGAAAIPWRDYRLTFRLLSEIAYCGALHAQGKTAVSRCELTRS